MELNLAEKFMILIQRPHRAGSLVSHQIRDIGFIGALIMDLCDSRNIVIENKKVIVNSIEMNLGSVHGDVLRILSLAKTNRSVKSWVSRLSRKSRSFQKVIVEKLERERILEVEHKKFLFFRYFKTRLANAPMRDRMIQDIRDAVFNYRKVEQDIAHMMGLIEACKMYKVVCNDRAERKTFKARFKEISTQDSIVHGIDQVAKEMQAAIVAAVVASSVTTHSG